MIERCRAARIDDVHPPSILKGVSDWRERARNACYSASKLAKLCSVSERTLRRYFHDELHLPLRDWLKRTRVAEAKSLLRAGVQIKATAFAVGYKHHTHFSRQFKSASGVAPRAWITAPQMCE